MFDQRTDDVGARALPFASGALVALAWFMLLDALLLRDASANPPLDPALWVPPGLATTALLLALVAPYRAFGESDDDGWVSSARQCSRLWLFTVMLLAMGSVYAAIGVHAIMHDDTSLRFGSGTDATHRRVGTAFVQHAVATAAGTALWVLRRVQVATGAF